MTIVAISREMGAGATRSAPPCQALNFEYVNRQILLQPRTPTGAGGDARGCGGAPPVLWERFDAERRRYLTFLEAAYYAFAERGIWSRRVAAVPSSSGRAARPQSPDHGPCRGARARVMAQDHLDRGRHGQGPSYDREMSGRTTTFSAWTGPNRELRSGDQHRGRCLGILYGPLVAARHPRTSPRRSRNRRSATSACGAGRAAIATDPKTNASMSRSRFKPATSRWRRSVRETVPEPRPTSPSTSRGRQRLLRDGGDPRSTRADPVTHHRETEVQSTNSPPPARGRYPGMSRMPWRGPWRSALLFADGIGQAGLC